MTLEWGDRTPPSDFFLRFGKLSNDRPKVTQITPQDLGKKPSSWGSGPVGTRNPYQREREKKKEEAHRGDYPLTFSGRALGSVL